MKRDARRALARGALLVVVGLLAVAGTTDISEAQGTVNFDIDPEITGNSANTLGAVENCVEITVPSPAFDDVSDHNIDIVVTGDTQSPIIYSAQLIFDATKVHIADPGTDPFIKMPPGGNRFDLSELRPDTDGQWNVGAFYWQPGFAGTPGNGAITRVGLDIGGSGLVIFTLTPEPVTDYGSDLGDHPSVVDPAGGMLAINTACPSPVGGIAELPDLAQPAAPQSDSPPERHIPLGALAVLAGVAASAGAWYARRGPAI